MDTQRFIDTHGIFPKTDDTFPYFEFTSMISPKRRFGLLPNDKDEFMISYCDDVFYRKSTSLGITQVMPGSMPVIVDIDLSVPAVFLQGRKQLYTHDHLVAVTTAFQQALVEIAPNVDRAMLVALVLEKPGYTDGHRFKNGFHLHFPNFIIEKHVYRDILYPRVLNKLEKADALAGIFTHGDSDLQYKYSEIFDRACFKNPWLMYGSRKSAGAGVYTLTGMIDAAGKLDRSIEAVYAYIAKHVPVRMPGSGERVEFETNGSRTMEYYLPIVLSIHTYHRDAHPIDERATALTSHEDAIARARRLVAHFQSSDKTSFENADDATIQRNLREASTLLDMVADTRADDYDDWTRIGWALYTISNGTQGGYDLWTAFSRRSHKYDEEHCTKFWTGSTNRGSLTMGTLRYYAKLDSPAEFSSRSNDESDNTPTRRLLEIAYNYSTHSGSADALFETYGSKYVCASVKYRSWYEYTGNRWKCMDADTSLRNRITPHAIEFVKTMAARMATANDEEDNMTREDSDDLAEVKKKLKMLLQKIRMQSKHDLFKASVMRECMCRFYSEEFASKLNADPYTIGCRNGVIDLKTNMFREGRMEDYISLQMNIDFKEFEAEDVEVKQVEMFLEQLFPDQTIRQFFLDNYCDIFVGGNPHKYLCIWSGEGDNGKSVNEALFEKMMGEYAVKLPTSLLTGKRTASSSACPELDRAGDGARWAVLQEPGHDESINAGILKELSGNDTIYTRGLFKEGREIKPLFKIALVCNGLPKIPYADKAVWNRIRVIPFEAVFTDEAPEEYEKQLEAKTFKKDRHFEDKLPGMTQAFAWVLMRHRRLRASRGTVHIVEPDKVMAATLAYKMRNDYYTQFVEETIKRCDDAGGDTSPTSGVGVMPMYNLFKDWFKMNTTGIQMPNKLEFADNVSKTIKSQPVNGMWVGFTLATNSDSGNSPFAETTNVDEFMNTATTVLC